MILGSKIAGMSINMQKAPKRQLWISNIKEMLNSSPTHHPLFVYSTPDEWVRLESCCSLAYVSLALMYTSAALDIAHASLSASFISMRDFYHSWEPFNCAIPWHMVARCDWNQNSQSGDQQPTLSPRLIVLAIKSNLHFEFQNLYRPHKLNAWPKGFGWEPGFLDELSILVPGC